MLFVLKLWVLSSDMKRKVDGTNIWLLKQITGYLDRRNPDGTWVTAEAGEVMGSEGMQLEAKYIGHR